MIATRRGLIVLLAIAVALAGALVLDVARAGDAVVTRELVPGLDVEAIGELRWTRPSQPPVAIRRDGARWRIDAPPGLADPAVVDAAITALRGARWQRDGGTRVAGGMLATLAITAGGASHTLAQAGTLDGGEQSWLVRDGGGAVIVDAWVIGALFPAADALRIRAPFAPLADRVVVERGGVTLDVDLAAGALREPAPLALQPAVVAALAQALSALAIVHVPAAPIAPAPDALTIRAGEVTVQVAGACPDDPQQRAIHATTGDGCVAAVDVAAIEAALAQLAGAPELIADPRPLAAPAQRITLLDGSTLDVVQRQLTAPGAAAGSGVDADRVDELLAALATPGLVVTLPATPPRGTLAITTAAGARSLDVYAGELVARRGEPVAIRVSTAAYAAIIAPGARLAEASLWTDEPTEIASLVIDGVGAFTRGSVLGEWSGGRPPGELDALAEAIAAPRVTLGDTPPEPPPAARVHVVAAIHPPIGADATRDFELARIGGRCALYASHGRAAWVAPAACAPLH